MVINKNRTKLEVLTQYKTMWSVSQIRGLSLPNKTLCLTFDDGPGQTIGDIPGPKTLRLAKFLNGQNISATFFMVGCFISQYRDIAREVHALGHKIGNHTYSHPNLDHPSVACTIADEIAKTDSLIKEISNDTTIFFRAPYGRWNLNAYNKALHVDNGIDHEGPFLWDINGADYKFWASGRPASECAQGYFAEISQVQRGIILMHDSTADIEHMRINNQTAETIEILVPKLIDEGYRFVGLEEVLAYQ